MSDPTPLPISEIEAEAYRVRIILDTEPPNDNSDMLYAAYNTLLFVLGYGTAPPTEIWGASSEEIRKRVRAAARDKSLRNG